MLRRVRTSPVRPRRCSRCWPTMLKSPESMQRSKPVTTHISALCAGRLRLGGNEAAVWRFSVRGRDRSRTITSGAHSQSQRPSVEASPARFARRARRGSGVGLGHARGQGDAGVGDGLGDGVPLRGDAAGEGRAPGRTGASRSHRGAGGTRRGDQHRDSANPCTSGTGRAWSAGTRTSVTGPTGGNRSLTSGSGEEQDRCRYAISVD